MEFHSLINSEPIAQLLIKFSMKIMPLHYTTQL